MTAASSLQGELFKNHWVNLDPRALQVGGSWRTEAATKTPTAWDQELLSFFHQRAQEISHPVVFDVGANTGSFSLLPKFHPGMKLFAFEPGPNISAILSENVALNGISSRVRIESVALADSAGSLTLKTPSSMNESGLACLGNPLRFSDWIETRVVVTTLDNYIAEQNIPSIDLLKIDTEGCELLVLMGGRNALSAFQPEILMEVQAENMAQFNYVPHDLFSFMYSIGYRWKQLGLEDYFFWHSSEDQG